MVARAKIAALPKDVRQWLDSSLAQNNFAGYQLLEAELKARGFSIGKSSIGRYSATLQRRLETVKAATDAARLIAAEAPDDAAQRDAAVMSMVSAEIFDTLMNLDDARNTIDPVQRAKMLSAVAKNVATLSRASVNQKKHELDIRTKLQAAQKTITAAAKRTGASKELIKVVEEQLGIFR